MISGGIETGEAVSECGRVAQEVSKVGDFNFDGHPDTIHATPCPGLYSDVYLEVGPTNEAIGRTLFGSGPNHDPLTPWAYKFSTFPLPGFRAAPKQGGILFSAGDLVQAPFGRKEGKPQGRIQNFYLEFDRDLNWIRTVAAIYTAEGSDDFDLSALTLISPIAELDQEATRLADSLKRTEEERRRQEILRYAEYYHLKPPFKKEVGELEVKLALAAEKEIDKMNLDQEGRSLLLDKVGKKLAFQRSATNLVSEARRKQEDRIPTSVL